MSNMTKTKYSVLLDNFRMDFNTFLDAKTLFEHVKNGMLLMVSWSKSPAKAHQEILAMRRQGAVFLYEDAENIEAGE